MLVLGVLTLINIVLVWVVLFKKKKAKVTEFYTDYTCGNTILRVFKPEFEYQAVGDLTRGSILDRGTLTPAYNWVLIEFKR